jgi:hypothetical protein
MKSPIALIFVLASMLFSLNGSVIAQNIKPISGVYSGYTQDFQEIMLEVLVKDLQVSGRFFLNHDSNQYFDYLGTTGNDGEIKGNFSQNGVQMGKFQAHMDADKIFAGTFILDAGNVQKSYYSMPVLRDFPSREEVQQAEMATAFQRMTDSINGFITQTPETQLPPTTVIWSTSSHDFGEITEGEIVAFRFEVTNTGEHDLMIVRVKPSCGCTTPQWTEEPIPPGQSGFVDIEFNSQGKPGQQQKTVTVICNTEPTQKILNFSCKVNPR